MEIGINFRQSSDYVTDDTGQTYCIGDSYPTTRGGVTFGWTDVDGTRNRSTSPDVRLAGTNLVQNNGGHGTFRLDLPSTGTYEIRLALGDYSYPQRIYVVVKDGSSTITTINVSSVSTGNFLDAEGTAWSAANWPDNNVAIEHTFTSTNFNLVFGTPTSLNLDSVIAHLYVKSIDSDTGNPWYYYAQQ